MPRRPRTDARSLVMPPGRGIPRQPGPAPVRPPPPVAEDADLPPALGRALSKASGELVALATAIRTCDACSRSGQTPVPGSGYPRADVFLLSERPSPQDLESGAAFSADAEPLAKAFAALGVPPWSLYGATAVRCGDAPADGDHLRACAPHLLTEIEAVCPRVVVAFGGRALEAVGSLDGRCGIAVPEDVPKGEPVSIRPGLSLLWTEPLPDGVTAPDAKRRLWRELQTLRAILA